MRKTPSLGYVGTTMTPATLDVYVNGSRVRSEELQPGTFRLDNLHVGGGRGIAQYVVRDVFGHEETYNAPFYASEGVLRAGLQDYSYSAGVLRSNLTTRSWDYGEGAVLGRHRIGLSDHLTLGARAEASRPVISGGPSLALALPIGQIDLELAMSRDTTSGTGMASYLAYGYASRVFGAGFFGRAMSSHYSTIDQRGYRDRALVEAGVFQSMPIGSYLSFGTQGSLSKYRDRGTSLRGSVQWALRIGSRANLFASASKARNEDGTAPWDVLLTLNYSLADRLNAAATGHVANGEPSLLLDANRSLPVGQGYGFRGSGVIAEHGNSSADALLQYQTLFGRYSGEYSYDHQRHRGSVEAAGGIAIVPGIGIFPTLPVQDGFAVIRVAGVKNVRGYVNNQELGRTDRNGNLLVPNLLSYYGNRLGIASEDVPIQYNMESTDLTLAPPLRGVAIADFSVSIPHYYRGHTIVDEHGTRVVPKYGDIRVMGPKHQELVSPLGEDGEFELENVPLGAQSFTIDYTGGECTFTLDIADSDQTVIDLGELVCHMP
jgi:outer membrane usher protein